MFGKGGLGNLMKQAQQMQEKCSRCRKKSLLEVTGESGAGLVKVTINGAHNCRRVEIDPSLLEDDKEMLEDRLLRHSTTRRVALKRRRKRRWPLFPPECSCRPALRCRSDAKPARC